MATTNYKFEKRQRDLAKKKKHEEKLQKKLERKQATTEAPATPGVNLPTSPPDNAP